MSELDYERVMRELCRSAGIAEWRDVARSGHIEIGERVIGLIPEHDVQERAPGLLVYIDLGPVYAERDAGVHRRLLVANLRSDPLLEGSFGIHPQSGHGVYWLRASAPVDGAELARRIARQLEPALEKFQQLMH